MDTKDVLSRLHELERRVASIEELLAGLRVGVDEPIEAPSDCAPAPLEVLSVDMRVVDGDEDYVRLAWRVQLANRMLRPCEVFIDVVFQDDGGFALHETCQSGVSVPAGGEASATGIVLVEAALADQVSRIVAKAEIQP